MDPIIIAKMGIYEYKYKKKGELIKKMCGLFFLISYVKFTK